MVLSSLESSCCTVAVRLPRRAASSVPSDWDHKRIRVGDTLLSGVRLQMFHHFDRRNGATDTRCGTSRDCPVGGIKV